VSVNKPYVAREHEFEAQYGLPELLPEGERILWQGSPRWQLVARQVFHADKVAIYFALILAWRAGSLWMDAGVDEALASLKLLLPLVALALAVLALMAWLTARTTAYTLTNRRVVMRIGIVLTVTYNLPLSRIEGAQLRGARVRRRAAPKADQPCRGAASEASLGVRDRRGDIVLALEPDTRIAWLQLWPHVRPWRVKRAEPMLRALDDAQAVAATLQQAWVDINGAPAAQPVVQPVAQPAATPQPQASDIRERGLAASA
jgi:Bacterial PH domain